MRAKVYLPETYAQMAARYVRRPNPSYTMRQAAACWWSMALQFEGETAAHNALAAAGIALPDFLRDVPPSGELVKRQKRERDQRRATMEGTKVSQNVPKKEGAKSTKKTHQRAGAKRISDATPRAA